MGLGLATFLCPHRGLLASIILKFSFFQRAILGALNLLYTYRAAHGGTCKNDGPAGLCLSCGTDALIVPPLF